jgi:hypothetical protein
MGDKEGIVGFYPRDGSNKKKVFKSEQIEEGVTCMLVFRKRGPQAPVSLRIFGKVTEAPFIAHWSADLIRKRDRVFRILVMETEGEAKPHHSEKTYPIKIFGIDRNPDKGNEMFIFPPSGGGDRSPEPQSDPDLELALT